MHHARPPQAARGTRTGRIPFGESGLSPKGDGPVEDRPPQLAVAPMELGQKTEI